MAENFVEAYMQYTSIYESPTSFWRWSAYSTISSVLHDKCYIQNGSKPLYPNLYVLILAESSGHRKNRPVEESEDFIHTVLPYLKLISGRATVQAIIDELGSTASDPKTGKVIKSSSATFFSTELSAGIVNDLEGIRILTDIYDYKPRYTNYLRTREKVTLDKTVFSMFSASNQEMLKDFFNVVAIKGGFLARTLLVVPNEFRAANSLLRVDKTRLVKEKNHALDHLKKVAELCGEFRLTEDAIDEYESWYHPFRKAYAEKREPTGIIGRIHTHILKLSAILAANELTLCIQNHHINRAIEECISLIPNYTLFTMHHAKNELGNIGNTIVLDLLDAKNHMLTRKELVRKNWQSMDIDMLEKAVLSLAEAGMLTIHDTATGMAYQLTPLALEMLS